MPQVQHKNDDTEARPIKLKSAIFFGFHSIPTKSANCFSKCLTWHRLGFKCQHILWDIVGHAISPYEVLHVGDESGITWNDFDKLYKKLKDGIKQVGRGLHLGYLPIPRQALQSRKELHNNLEDVVGKPLFLNNTCEVGCNNKSLKSKDTLLQIDNFNKCVIGCWGCPEDHGSLV